MDRLPKILDVKPHLGGWKVFEMPGVEPWFTDLDSALSYARTRQGFSRGEIRVLDASGEVTQTFAFDQTTKPM